MSCPPPNGNGNIFGSEYDDLHNLLKAENKIAAFSLRPPKRARQVSIDVLLF